MTPNFEINWAINTDTKQTTFMQDHKIIWENVRSTQSNFLHKQVVFYSQQLEVIENMPQHYYHFLNAISTVMCNKQACSLLKPDKCAETAEYSG